MWLGRTASLSIGHSADALRRQGEKGSGTIFYYFFCNSVYTSLLYLIISNYSTLALSHCLPFVLSLVFPFNPQLVAAGPPRVWFCWRHRSFKREVFLPTTKCLLTGDGWLLGFLFYIVSPLYYNVSTLRWLLILISDAQIKWNWKLNDMTNISDTG